MVGSSYRRSLLRRRGVEIIGYTKELGGASALKNDSTYDKPPGVISARILAALFFVLMLAGAHF